VTLNEASPAAPAGWYPEPDGTAGYRWWDGFGWTGHTQPEQISTQYPSAPDVQPQTPDAASVPSAVETPVFEQSLPTISGSVPVPDTNSRAGRHPAGVRRRPWLVAGVAAAALVLGGATAAVILVPSSSDGKTDAAGTSSDAPKHTINGTLDLPISACSSSGGGYSDIGVGTPATVTNEKNEVLGQGSLEASTTSYCTFTFKVTDLQDAVRYGVTVSDRGTIWNTK
jgi:hypothetical protein